MTKNVRVLVVDDQPNIVEMLATVLRFQGFAVDTAASASEALAKAAADRPDLLVLDVLLPDGDGFEVCRTLRARGHNLGVVFLTARDAPGDKVAGLAFGGDDYVTKPFSVDELIARARAVLRRIRPDTIADTGPGVLRVDDLELDERACQVRRGEQLISLSPTEFKLLRYLMLNAGCVVSRRQVLDAVWGYDFGGARGIVDTYVSYLRRKLDPLGPTLIGTQRGFGYVLRSRT